MGFEHPQLLLLELLVIPLMRLLRIEGRTFLNGLRAAILALGVLCMARPFLDRTGPGVDVVVVADRSASIGLEGRASEAELLRLLASSPSRGSHDRLGLVSFGREAAVERALNGGLGGGQNSGPGGGLPGELGGGPDAGLPGGLVSGSALPEFHQPVEDDASDLASALTLASHLVSPHRRTRFVVLSDGAYTGTDPLEPGLLAGLSQIPVWYRPVGRLQAGDVAAGPIGLPPETAPGSSFPVRFTIHSLSEVRARYLLRRGNLVIAQGEVRLAPGDNTFFARDMAGEAGMAEYRLEVKSPGDPVAENDTSTALLWVRDAPRVLLASGAPGAGLVKRALEAAHIPVDLPGKDMDWSAARLAPYRLLILENLPLERLGRDGALWVAGAVEAGTLSLLVTGGEGAFGQGGYHRSPIDPLLPVSMELKENQHKASLALVAALDRSGSMQAPVADGRVKMDLADLGVAEAVKLLEPDDQVSVIAVDTAAHVIVPLVQADDTGRLEAAILAIRSEGGGIFVKTALEAAVAEVRKSQLPTRHLLLFADAGDSEEPEGAVALARALGGEGIDLSVIGLGTRADKDAAFLIELAGAGGGEIYFTESAEDLPRVFGQDTIRASRRGFVRDATRLTATSDIVRLQLPAGLKAPDIGGYNLTSLRSGASCALMTGDENKAPVAAFWQHGRARVGAITAEVDGPWSGDFSRWERAPGLLVNLARTLMVGSEAAGASISSQSRGGQAEIRVELDEQTAERLRLAPLSVRLLGPVGTAALEAPLTWEQPGVAVARVELPRVGHYLPVVDLGEAGVLEAPPLTLAYSPELMPAGGRSAQTLAGLGTATRGGMLDRIDEAWSPAGLAAEESLLEVTRWLALGVLLLVLVEVAEKRVGVSGLVGRGLRRLRRSIED